MSRRGFGNLALAVFFLGVFATSLSVFRSLFGEDETVTRATLFWALVSVALAANLFYGAVIVLRRRVLTRNG